MNRLPRQLTTTKFFKSLQLLLAAVCVANGSPPVTRADDEIAVVKPAETDAILANPGIGWETFNCTRTEDRNLPDWIPSTIYYTRWGWNKLEPQPGTIDTHLVDGALERARKAGQQLAFRPMTCNPIVGRPYHPAWLKEVGGRELMVDYGDIGPTIPIPDFDDAVVLDRHLDFIKRLGQRYDGHPDLLRVEIGSIGWWGEWHLSRCKLAKLPALEHRVKVVDAYLAAFKKTPLMIVINAEECMSHAAKNGVGWRADSLGDLGSFSPKWNHMHDRYPAEYKQHNLEDVWKTAPISFEPPNNVSEFVAKNWPLRGIFNYGLALHGSSFSGKSAPLPADKNFRQELRNFLRRLGYRLVLSELSHPAQLKPGAKTLAITTKWRNVGSAPCYRPYRVAYRLTGPDGRHTVAAGGATVNTWLPGSVTLFDEAFQKEPPDLPPGSSHDVVDQITLPDDMPEGEYALAVAIVGEASNKPVVRLAIEGLQSDGWYPLSTLNVGN
jgi:hypothetical protein